MLITVCVIGLLSLTLPNLKRGFQFSGVMLWNQLSNEQNSPNHSFNSFK